MFFDLLQLLEDFCTENIIKKKKKEWSSTEQASNEAVTKNSWRYLFVASEMFKTVTRGQEHRRSSFFGNL